MNLVDVADGDARQQLKLIVTLVNWLKWFTACRPNLFVDVTARGSQRADGNVRCCRRLSCRLLRTYKLLRSPGLGTLVVFTSRMT